MYSNYLVSALRSLGRQKLFALINTTGLAIGLAACMLIILFVRHEYSYDTMFSDIERLYRIEATANIPGQPSNESPQFFGPAHDLLKDAFDEIESIARLQQRGGTVVAGDTAIAETFATVDPEFLTLFDFPLLEGDRDLALNQPTSIVLTEEMARKHLGSPPWLNRTIVINETLEREFKVTAVIADLPGNTHFDIDFLIPIDQRVYDAAANGGRTDLNRWNGLPFFVYVKLKEGRQAVRLKTDISAWVDRYFPSEIQALVGISGSELFTPRIMSVADIHMKSPVQFDMKAPGNLTTILSFSGIASLILSIACINFMNLATATSTLRAKEVALRKVMGASRKQLFIQFELESILSSIVAVCFALAIISLVLPAFSNFTEREIVIDGILDPLVAITVIGLTLTVGFFAGLHPAWVLSGFRPARVLQSAKLNAGSGTGLRSLLVLFQFTISAALMIMTLLIYVQTDYARSLNMGYDNSNTLTVRGLFRQQIGDMAETVRDEVARIPGVTQLSLSSFTPGDGRNVGLSLKVPGKDERLIIFYRAVYPEFFEQFDVKPIAGRLLDHAHENDRTVFISDPDSTEPQQINAVINEAAVATMGFSSPQDAIGKTYFRGRANQIVNTIVGVVPDIHFGSPRTDLDGEIYMFIPAEARNLLVSYRRDISGADPYPEVSRLIQDKLQVLVPRSQTTIAHLQENIAEQYQEEAIISTLLAMFAALAVLIACMGLFGLASFTVARRTREIGIRKVMGASSSQVMLMLVTQFSKPVLLANMFAWPMCWYAFNVWLAGFNERIDILPWFTGISALAVLTTLTLAFATVATYAIKVARSSPVLALRYE